MNHPPKFGPTGEAVYERTYRRIKADGQPETWADTVTRVVDGNLGLVDKKFHEKGEREKLLQLFYDFKALPAGRHLWMSGVPGRQFLMNCWRAGWSDDLTEHFSFTFDQLMQGGGVGANYSNRYLKQYSTVKHAVDVHIVCDPDHPDYYELKDLGLLSSEYSYEWDGCTRIEDSREGWADALADLLRAFWNGAHVLVFDVSLIRFKGAKIKAFGGTAAGPMPLAKLLMQVAKLLSKRVGQKMSSLDAMLIDHWIGDCVVSGNVRRSARMSIKVWSDPDIFDFINCKKDSGEHWTTNISVEIDDAFFRALKKKDDHATRVYRSVVTGMLTNGEPGFYNRSLAQVGELEDVGSTNPCVTGDTLVLTEWGPRRVEDLLGGPLGVYVDGKFRMSPTGFFKTGTKEAFTLNTREGFNLNLTFDHQVMTDRGWIEAGQLVEGDKIHLHKHENVEWDGHGTHRDGYLVGHYLGDGTISNARTELRSWGDSEGEQAVRAFIADEVIPQRHRSDFKGWNYNPHNDYWYMKSGYVHHVVDQYFENGIEKSITDAMLYASSDFQRGLISGLFDTDGHIEGDSRKGGVSIRLSQSSRIFLETVQRMLLNFGVRSKLQMARTDMVRTMPDGKGGVKEYETAANWRLIITSDAPVFMQRIGFVNSDKTNKYYAAVGQMVRGFYEKPWTVTFESLTPIGAVDVYDIQVPDVNAFDANGVYVHNCGEITLNEWEYCCLGHVNLDAFHNDFEGAVEAHRLMTRFLLRATFGDIPNEKSQHVGNRNRRIGVGHFGFQGWLVKQGIRYSDSHRDPYVRKTLRDFYDTVRKEARRYSYQLRVPEPIKVTTVAPTGSIAKLPGRTEGIHPILFKYFVNRIRFSTVDPGQLEQLAKFEAEGRNIEDCVYSSNTKVVSFVAKNPLMEEVEALGLDADYLVEEASEIEFADMLAVQAMYQTEYTDNAVSFTINVKPDMIQQADWQFQLDQGTHPLALKMAEPSKVTVDDAAATLIHYLPHLKGTTIMVDGARPQAPYERLTREQFLAGGDASVLDAIDLDCAQGACPIR